MRDTSFVVSPIRYHAFFEQTVLQGELGNDLLERGGLLAQALDVVGAGGTGGVACKPALASLHELLGPGVIQALGDAFLAAQLGDAVLAAQAVQNDPDLVLGREVPPGRTADILDHLLRRLFGSRRSKAHLRSFVTATRPKPSLNHTLKSGPQALMGDNAVVALAQPPLEQRLPNWQTR